MEQLTTGVLLALMVVDVVVNAVFPGQSSWRWSKALMQSCEVDCLLLPTSQLPLPNDLLSNASNQRHCLQCHFHCVSRGSCAAVVAVNAPAVVVVGLDAVAVVGQCKSIFASHVCFGIRHSKQMVCAVLGPLF